MQVEGVAPNVIYDISDDEEAVGDLVERSLRDPLDGEAFESVERELELPASDLWKADLSAEQKLEEQRDLCNRGVDRFYQKPPQVRSR